MKKYKFKVLFRIIVQEHEEQPPLEQTKLSYPDYESAKADYEKLKEQVKSWDLLSIKLMNKNEKIVEECYCPEFQ